jgi:NAD(P)-dependent dehydrogenase (short-subunit alcohol dehydrogenase family)
MSTVLITGCSKGIGFETALIFARAGHSVLATMRNPSRSPELAAMAKSENLPIAVSAMDVDSDDSVREGIAALTAAHGDIDVLINNAGIEAVGSVEELPLASFRAVMETNYFGMLRCTQAIVPQMRARQAGCIVNVSSISGRIATPPFAAYCASKWAMEGLSEVLAAEMKTFGVRVLLVEPGIIDTEMARRIGGPANESAYMHSARFTALFSDALQRPVPASLVATEILKVVQSGTWQLRHLVGPDTVPLISLRNSMTDEDWVALNAADDATFFARLAGGGEA